MKTILVVDDASIIRELLRGVLEPEGYRILLAADGEEALTLAAHNAIDLSIVDVFLPKKSGMQVIAELAKSSPAQHIIAISGGAAFNPDAILELTDIFKVAATFTKPLDTVALLRKIKELLHPSA
ncbi:MAG: response regulator transcription factor [Desulfovibrionaceae bacterium]